MGTLDKVDCSVTCRLILSWREKLKALEAELAEAKANARSATGDRIRVVTELKEQINILATERDELRELRAFLETRCVPSNTPPIVCLCGSTRFMDAFFEAGWKFTLNGYIVLSVGVCKHAEDHGGEALGQEVADKLDKLHLRKIDLADSVHVLNVDGYIGESTKKEIEYATSKHKPITYLAALQPPKKEGG